MNKDSKKHCIVIDCDNKYYAKGLCKYHYGKQYRLNYDRTTKIIKKCIVIDCDKVMFSRSYCYRHYNMYIDKPSCSVDGCNDKARIKGMCSKHYRRESYKQRKLKRKNYYFI